MKLCIKADGVRLRLWLPLSLLKTSLGYKVVQRAVAQEVNKRTKKVTEQTTAPQSVQVSTQQNQSTTSITREQVLEMYKILKQCIKVNGHFNLVEVESHDGEKVLIRV